MYPTPEGLLDKGEGPGYGENLEKFYASKKGAYEDYLKEEKKNKSE